MRFHLCAAIYVFTAARLAELDLTQVALLCICVFGVIAMELMNSAVERAVDKPDTTHWWSAGAAKDMAAGAVLAAALGALCVGVCLFGNRTAWDKLWGALTGSAWGLGCAGASLVVAYLFVFRFGASQDGSKNAK